MYASDADTISCFTNTNYTEAGAPAVQSIRYNATTLVWQYNATANGTYSNFSANGTYSANASWTWNNATGNGTLNSSLTYTEPIVCASYKLDLCKQGFWSWALGSGCSDYQNVPGVGTWAYYPLTLSQCYQMQWMSQQIGAQFKEVRCCSTDECNAPDPAEDSRTLIVGPTATVANIQQCKLGAHVSTPDVLGATVNWTVSVEEANPFPGTYLAFVKLSAALDPAWEAQQLQLGQHYTHWSHAVLPLQPSLFEPPASYHIPTSFTVHAFGDGHCQVSSIPVAVFGGTAELYVHVGTSAAGEAWVEVWGRQHDDVDVAKARGHFGVRGWSRNVVKFISMLHN